jgi:hypothetical protein
LLLAGLALAVHLGFHAIDSRPAVDVGHTWSDVVNWLEGGRSAPRGPYHWMIALWTWMIGRTPWAFVLVDGLWTAVLAGGIAVLAARVRPQMWVLGAAVLVMPMFPTIARTHWIHHAEAALAVTTLLLAEVLPATLVGGLLLGLVAGFGASVRPSALVWVLPAMLPWLARADRKRWLILLPGLALAADSLAGSAGYAGMRWSLRGANAAAVGDVWRLWPVLTGIIPGIALLALAGMGARAAPKTNIGRIGLFWAVAGVLVVAVSHAGPDNVPTAIIGLILVAAHANVPDRLVPALAVLLLGPITLIPALDGLAPLSGWSSRDEPLNWLVPRTNGTTIAKIEAARQAVCGERPTCRVALQRGLVHPSWEDDGRLGLYLGGIDGLECIPVEFRGRWADGRPDGIVAVECGGDVPDPTARFPGIDTDVERLLDDAVPAGTVIGNGCTWTWYRLRG